MSRFIALMRVSFLGLLKTFSFGGKKKASGTGAVVLMVVLCLYVSGVYSVLFASLFGAAGEIALMPLMMAAFSVLMSFMLTLFAGSGVLFGAKDIDFIFALPVSAFEILLSKIMALYLENLVLMLLMMAPCGVIYLTSGGSGGAGFLPLLLLGTLFLAVIPTFFDVIFGYLIAWATSRMQKKNLLSTLLYLLLFVGIMVLSFRLNAMLGAVVSHAQAVYRFMNSWLLPVGLFGRACGGSPAALLGLAAVVCLPFLLLVWLFSRSYKAILTRLSAHTIRRDYRLGESGEKASRPFAALYKKEAGRLFGSSVYLLNTCLGAVMLLILCVLALVKRQALLAVLDAMGEGMPVFQMVVVITAVLLATIDTTCVSISLEGNRLWLLKAAPIRAFEIFRAKIALNLTISLPVAMLSVGLLGAVVRLPVLQILLGWVACSAFALFTAVLGLLINLRFPKLDAESDAIVVKQSLSSFLGGFGGVMVAVITAALYGALSGLLSFELFLLFAAALFGLGGALGIKWLSGHGERAFLRL